MFTTNQLPGRTLCHEGREYLFFSGTSYLGLAQNPVLHTLLAQGVAHYGLQFGSSRNGNLQLAVFAEAEAKLARLVGAPAALTVSSGMLAGQLTTHWLAQQVGLQAIGYQAVNTHPALWQTALPAQVRVLPPAPTDPTPAYLLTNSVDALYSETPSFEWLSALPKNQPVYLVVDDSHGLGVLEEGRGIWPVLSHHLRHHPAVCLLVTASLGKAMGLPGGVVFGEPGTLTALRQTAYFGGCSPMPPAYAHAFLHADAVYATARQRLRQNIALAQELLLPLGCFQQADGYPVFYTDQDEMAAFLLEKGIFVYSFAYPTPAHKANTRVVISALHEPTDIQQLAETVREWTGKR